MIRVGGSTAGELTGSYVKGLINGRPFGRVSIIEFGGVEGGVVDNTAAVLNAMTALGTTGGIIEFGPGTWLINGQLNLPDNQAATNPTQPSIRLTGAGASHSGRGTAPAGGTILDMRFAGASGKIVTLGLGLLEIDNLTLADYGTDSTPFIYTTYTTLHIHDCEFYGTKVGTLADQDAIVMGGTQDVEGPRGLDVGFQGYGTVIRDNYFARIRRAVYGRMYFNGNVITANTIWNSCGSNLVGGAAIELDGDPLDVSVQVSTGNYIAGNLIEMVNYPYAFRLRETQKNALIGNNLYDPTATTLGHYFFDTSAQYNYVVAGYHADTKPFNSGGATNNTFVNPHQGQESNFTEPQRFRNEIRLQPSVDPTTPKGVQVFDSAGNQFYPRLEVGNRVSYFYIPNGGVETKLFEVRDFGGGVIAESIMGTDSRLDAGGKLRIRSGVGQELWLGALDVQNIYVLNGVLNSTKANGTAPMAVVSKTPVANLTVQRIASGALLATTDAVTSGPQIFTGTGTPETFVTAPVGSLYLRSDGGAATTMYVKESGVAATGWIAK